LYIHTINTEMRRPALTHSLLAPAAAAAAADDDDDDDVIVSECMTCE